jgi:arylsulfatase A-like enzyme
MTQADRVIVVLFDGLRPDMIAGAMPHLHRFAEDGLWFTEGRSVFPSMTRVATTSLATGQWPRAHGIVNNAFHMPELVQGRPLDSSNFEHLSRLKAQEPVVSCASLGHALAAAGKRMGAVHCGSPGSSYLVNHDVAQHGHWTFSVHGEGATQTPEAVRRAVAAHGPLPPQDVPKLATLDYARRAFLGMALGEDAPDVALMWLPEPDTTWHQFGLGSDEARQVMAAADAVFADVLEAVSALPGRSTVIAMSDHGQITTSFQTDITAEMQADGLPASHRPGDGHKLALTRGNMGEIRSLDGDMALIRAACDWLMERDDIGMVFARDDLASDMAGTLPHSLVMHGHPRDPELFFLMRSSDALDSWGLPGQGGLIAGVPLGGGMHGGLNRYELTTTLAVQTPDGRRGLDTSPVGLIDIAPTITALLGARMPAAGAPLPLFAPRAAAITSELSQASRAGFAQELRHKFVDGRMYLDHGGRLDAGRAA